MSDGETACASLPYRPNTCVNLRARSLRSPRRGRTTKKKVPNLPDVRRFSEFPENFHPDVRSLLELPKNFHPDVRSLSELPKNVTPTCVICRNCQKIYPDVRSFAKIYPTCIEKKCTLVLVVLRYDVMHVF